MMPGEKNLAILRLNLTPGRSGAFSDVVFGNEFARSRGQYVVIFFELVADLPA